MELDTNIRNKVLAYKPSRERLAAIKDVPLLFMVGISGAGKNTITQQLLASYPNDYHEFVTHTTRAPRKNHGILEKDGVDYHFIDITTADQMLDAQQYIEANVYSNNIYGTSISEIEAAQTEHRIAIGDIDVNGVANFVRLGLAVKPIFILPPNYDTWQQRLMTRYKGHELNREDWLRRMHTAYDEIEHALATDYFYMVVNDDITETIETIHAIAHGLHIKERRPDHAVAVAREILEKIDRAVRTTTA